MANPAPCDNAAPAASSAASVEPPEDGPRLLGRYLLLRRIARGGMGEVYLASTTGLEGAERPVVVKVIRREHVKDPSFNARFLDEARVQAQLQHSGVAQVLEADVDKMTDEPYAVVEYVEGRSLGDVRTRALQLGQKLHWAEAVAIATLIAEALAHVHERKDAGGRALGIVHRDLSPQNVMVGFGGDIKIIDFGTARGQNRRCHTISGVVFAKPGYVAPEVANGDSGDARVDIYALGIILWELCAGRRFLQGDAQAHMAAVAKNNNDPPPIAEEAGAPAELDAIVAWLTAFDREERYGASRAAARDLAKLLVTAPALSSGERGVRARVAHLMQRLFSDEPARSRREFARLLTASRACYLQLLKAKSQPNETDGAQLDGSEAETNPDGRATERVQSPALAASTDILPGTRYRLVRMIGQGANSLVYEAEHIDLGSRMAVKVMQTDKPDSVELGMRFRREARILSKLSHEHLVKVVDFGVTQDDRLFSSMDLLEGETLDVYMARNNELGWQEALGFASKVLTTLEYVHDQKLVHRDIKPSNLYLTKEGGFKLLDFGLARSIEEAAEATDHSAANAISIVGTPEYMAPEQATAGRVDERADLYALGCVLYEVLTGRLPFVAESPVALLDAKIKGSPERMGERAAARQIPRVVDDLVMRALARHPSVRFQSAAEMRQAVNEALAFPLKKRVRRRTLGYVALATTIAFAGVLFAAKGATLTPSLSQLSAWMPWAKKPTTALESTMVVHGDTAAQTPSNERVAVSNASSDETAHVDPAVSSTSEPSEEVTDIRPEPKPLLSDSKRTASVKTDRREASQKRSSTTRNRVASERKEQKEQKEKKETSKLAVDAKSKSKGHSADEAAGKGLGSKAKSEGGDGSGAVASSDSQENSKAVERKDSPSKGNSDADAVKDNDKVDQKGSQEEAKRRRKHKSKVAKADHGP